MIDEAIEIEERDMAGRIVVVTGANCGLGYATAKALLERGAAVVLACRSLERGSRAVDALRAELNAAGDLDPARKDAVHLMQLDLASLRSVEHFAREFKSRFDHLDVLINNAGIMWHPYEKSEDNIEMHFATNHIGHFHLVNELLEPLARAPRGSRIVIVSSGYYKKATKLPTIKELTSDAQPSDYTSPMAYARSKLANCLHAVALAKRLEKSHPHMKVLVMRPGFVRGTELGRQIHPMMRWLSTPVVFMFAKNIQQGIATIVHCAVAADSLVTSGLMYNDEKPEQFGEMVNEETAEQMWTLSEELVKCAKAKWTDEIQQTTTM